MDILGGRERRWVGGTKLLDPFRATWRGFKCLLLFFAFDTRADTMSIVMLIWNGDKIGVCGTQ